MLFAGGFMKKLSSYLVLSLFFVSTAFAVEQAWVSTYNGPISGDDNADAITVDSSGNVYVVGYSYGSGTQNDYAAVKYNSAGVQQWVARYDGPASSYDEPHSIAVDSSGNVYVTGYSYGSGAGVDYATVKYNSVGAEQWVSRYDGAVGDDGARKIAVDSSGNVYVAGYSRGAGTSEDYATVKYDSDGGVQWVSRYNGPGSSTDWAKAMAIDSSGNVYVTGYSDAGGINHDYATVKYNSVGAEQWVARYNAGMDYSNAITVDSSGNVYVTGESLIPGPGYDYATVKYDSTGAEQWVQRYDSPAGGDDRAYSIAVDSSGNVYVTGFSPGSGTGSDYATVKYDSAGAEQWVARYNGLGNSDDYARSVAIDSSGNVYVTGESMGSGANYNYATVKYNSSGDQQWVEIYDRAGGNEDAKAITVDGSGSVYVTGYSYDKLGKGAQMDFATIKYTQAPPDTEPPSVSAVVPITALNNALVQFNVTATDNVAVTGCTFYWDGASNGSMANVGGSIWAKNYTPTSDGAHYAWANCTDAAGNTNKTNATITVNVLNFTYSQDYDGSADSADYTATFGGNETGGYDWANAVKIHVPAFGTGWLFLNLSMPSGATEATLAVFKYNDTDTTQMTAGAYGEAGRYNVTDNRIYINVTAGDPDFGGVGPGGGEVDVGVAAAPESPLAALAIIGAALVIGALMIFRRR
jgi:uncharacterized delta-60 repeat protein